MWLLSTALVAGLANPEFVTCQLAKRVKIQGEMVCIYRGPNGTLGYHYPSYSFSECPKQFSCRYTPNAKRRPTVKEILNGLKEGFEE